MRIRHDWTVVVLVENPSRAELYGDGCARLRGAVRAVPEDNTVVSPKRRPQTGTEWRMLAHPTRGGDSFDIRSRDLDNKHGGGTVMAKQMVLDEVVLVLGDGCIHIEQMSNRQWYLGVGDRKVMIWVDKNGKLTMGEWYE